jgi:prohibitin 2
MNAIRGLVAKIPKPSGGGGGPSEGTRALFGLLGLTGFVGACAYESFYDIQPGTRAILFSRITGIRSDIIEPGAHFLLPFIERPIIFDVKKRPRNIQSLTGSNDLQMVTLNVRVLTRPRVSKLPSIYQELGEDYDDRVLPSIVNEVCKLVVAQYNATQLLTQRAQVSTRIKDELIARADKFDIIMDDVALTELRFSNEFRAAVEAKQVAQQDAERSKFYVVKALEEKKSITIRAEGEARSAELISKSMKDNPGFIELRRLDTAKEIAGSIARSRNQVYLNADSLLLNLLERVDGSSHHTK